MGKRRLDTLRAQIAEIEAGGSTADGLESCEHDDALNKTGKASKQAYTEDDAFQRIIKLCSCRERSAYEMTKRLNEDGFSEPVIEAAVEKAKSYAILDDERYASAYIHDALMQRKGSFSIHKGLEKAGIERDIIENLMNEEVDESSQLADAVAVLRAKPIHAKNVHDAAFRRLIQRGYPAAIATQAVRIWSEE